MSAVLTEARADFDLRTQQSYAMAGRWLSSHALVADIRHVGVAQVQPATCVGMWEVRFFSYLDRSLSESKPLDREAVGLWLFGMGFDADAAEWRQMPISRGRSLRTGVRRTDKTPTDLYRCFDRGGSLLYVGVSLSVAQRMGQHRIGSGWWDDVSRIEIERHPDRATALSAEAHAILVERPIHNAEPR